MIVQSKRLSFIATLGLAAAACGGGSSTTADDGGSGVNEPESGQKVDSSKKDSGHEKDSASSGHEDTGTGQDGATSGEGGDDDTGTADAGEDASGGHDSGALDAGEKADTGAHDSGTKTDAGSPDAGHHDAGAASCTFNGKTVASGSDVSPSPYKSATVPFGDTCETETVSCDNGVLSPTGASPTCTVLPSTAATPALRQYAVEQTNGGSTVYEVNSVKQFTKPTVKGNTIWVVTTIPNDGGQGNVKVTDTQGNTFTSLNYEEDNSNGHQSVWHFYATNIKGDGATADTVTVEWANDNYKGVLIAEVSGVTAASLLGHSGNIQDHNAPGGTDTVTSGAITVSTAQTPALLLSVSMDTYGGTSDEGGDGYAGPEYGNGFTPETYLWNWDPGDTCNNNLACNLAAFETKAITASGSTAALFTARAPVTVSDTGAYVTVSAIFH